MRYLLIITLIVGAQSTCASEPDFQEQELSTKLRVGYAVRLIDMNADKRLDICIVDSKRILWLENPHWTEHVLIEDKTKTDNVCFAPHDINGDGHLDFAVGADWTVNTKAGGTIQWITGGGSLTGPWKGHPIGSEPTVHRMRFADCDGDGRPELFVLPLMGRNTSRPHFQEHGVRILSFAIPKDPVNGPWVPEVVDDSLHVTHNFWPTDLNKDGKTDLLVVSFEGVHLFQRQGKNRWSKHLIGVGDQQSSPNRGASEIRHGKFGSGKDYIATIEPWHGNQVVVYTPPAGSDDITKVQWDRHVLDKNLKWGHAVFCANLDDDPHQELVIGVRDNLNEEHKRGVRIYDPVDESGSKWKPHLD